MWMPCRGVTSSTTAIDSQTPLQVVGGVRSDLEMISGNLGAGNCTGATTERHHEARSRVPVAVELLEEAGRDPTVAIDDKGARKGHPDHAGIRVHEGNISVDVRGDCRIVAIRAAPAASSATLLTIPSRLIVAEPASDRSGKLIPCSRLKLERSSGES